MPAGLLEQEFVRRLATAVIEHAPFCLRGKTARLGQYVGKTEIEMVAPPSLQPLAYLFVSRQFLGQVVAVCTGLCECISHTYIDRPPKPGRLIVIRPSLLGRVLWCQPRLLGLLLRPSELAKLLRPSVWSKFGQRIVRGRKSVAGMFPKG